MNLQFSSAPEHEAFFWKVSHRAALLIHGYPGSPAEMRPLGELIRECGWSVKGLLLPGFGADIGTLEGRSYTDWTQAVAAALFDLKRDHSSIVVAGYSMGGSLALNAALEHELDGLMLLAPFWSIGNSWVNAAWPLIALCRSRVQLLRQADFSSSEVRKALLRMFGAIDLDDLAVREQIRNLSVSTRSISQVLNLGRRVARDATRLTTPALVIQGSQDPIVLAHRTRKLIRRFACVPRYHEIEAGHDLVDPEAAGWPIIVSSLVDFFHCLGTGTGRQVVDCKSP